MKKIIFLVTLLGVTFSFSEEVSVFGAGNIVSTNPYGLTENEQVLLDSKKRIDQVIAKQKSQEEDMIGLRSVVEGSQNQVSKLESRVSDLEIRTSGKVSNLANSNTSVASKSDIDSLKKDIDELKKQVEAINQKLNIQGSVKKNSSPVAKTENKENISKSQTLNNLDSKKPSNNQVASAPKKVVGFDDMKPADIEKEAKALFEAKKYQDAKIYYDYLVSKNYKPAQTHFMLGQISFNQKSYANAIKSYQNSLKNSDNAPYVPELLLNSGVSLEKLGDKANADKFYTYLKTKYPNSSQAKSLNSK